MCQCVQWQVDHSGRRLKTVFACSACKPIELIDWEHLAQREPSIDAGHKLISLYENL